MGHTNSTPNLNLPQFVGSDKPTWLSDVNGAMLAIDNAYGTIEAQASSAATAAAGAVAAAGEAQTAAESAASAAATAGTNASQALSTANNAAYTANQADGKATSALALINGEVIATATADGVKSYKDIFDSMLSLSEIADLSMNSKFVIDIEGTVSIHNAVIIKAGDYACFNWNEVTETGTNITQTVKFSGSNSSSVRMSTTTSTTTFTDTSATLPPSGTVFTLYK